MQLFESFAEELSPELYERWALSTQQQVFAGLTQGANSLLFAKECPYLAGWHRAVPKDLVSARVDLRKAQELYPDLIWQGNVSNQLLRDGSLTEITKPPKPVWRHQWLLSHSELEPRTLADTSLPKYSIC